MSNAELKEAEQLLQGWARVSIPMSEYDRYLVLDKENVKLRCEIDRLKADTFLVCFAPGRVGQERCGKQCAECRKAERECNCGHAWGEMKSRRAHASCPFHGSPASGGDVK
jgi:hypothetical protein